MGLRVVLALAAILGVADEGSQAPFILLLKGLHLLAHLLALLFEVTEELLVLLLQHLILLLELLSRCQDFLGLLKGFLVLVLELA